MKKLLLVALAGLFSMTSLQATKVQVENQSITDALITVEKEQRAFTEKMKWKEAAIKPSAAYVVPNQLMTAPKVGELDLPDGLLIVGTVDGLHTEAQVKMGDIIKLMILKDGSVEIYYTDGGKLKLLKDVGPGIGIGVARR